MAEIQNNKLLLYDIFSYSCMNCLRSVEYIKQIDRLYKPFGLETIIVHPPEWEFEKNEDNILACLRRQKIDFPLIVDREMKFIGELGIDFWPTQILMREEHVLYKHIGEGNYKDLEEKIIALLEIKRPELKKLFPTEPSYSKYPAFYGGARKKGLISYLADKTNSSFDFGTLYVSERWRQEGEYLRSEADGQTLKLATRGRRVNFVAEPLCKKPIVVSVKKDDEAVGTFKVTKSQLYNLFEAETDEEHILTITTDHDLAIYAFSFE